MLSGFGKPALGLILTLSCLLAAAELSWEVALTMITIVGPFALAIAYRWAKRPSQLDQRLDEIEAKLEKYPDNLEKRLNCIDKDLEKHGEFVRQVQIQMEVDAKVKLALQKAISDEA